MLFLVLVLNIGLGDLCYDFVFSRLVFLLVYSRFR